MIGLLCKWSGMEAAAALVKSCPNMTAIDILPTPFAMVLGKEVGQRLQQVSYCNTS